MQSNYISHTRRRSHIWHRKCYRKLWCVAGGCAAQQRRPAVEFDCPEEFGYYPHPSDCTQYYVCVFGGALLESCTGGLMYRSVDS